MESRMVKNQMTIDDLIEHFGVGRYQYKYLVIMSVLQMVDGAEILMLTFLGPLLQCRWNITPLQMALIPAISFLGMMLGAPMPGILADKYGRKPILLLCSCAGAFYSILSSLAPTLYWFYILRFFFGFFVVGNLNIASTIMTEVTPAHFRAKAQSIMFVSWCVGSLLIVAIAAGIYPVLGWRWFVFFGSLPLLFGIVTLLYTDESIRFLAVSGQTEKAMVCITKLSLMNNVPMPNAKLDLSKQEAAENTGNYKLLFTRKFRRVTVVLYLLWFFGSAMYFAAVILSTTMPTISYSCLQKPSNYFPSEAKRDDCCRELHFKYYAGVLIATIGDFVSCVVDGFLLDWVGRKCGLFICGIAAGLFFILLDFCVPILLRNIMFLGLRCATLSFADALFVFTLELYPTTIRSSALGSCNFLQRAGGAVAPFLAVVMLEYNTRLTLLLFSGVIFVTSICVFLIPYETSDQSLVDYTPSEETDKLRCEKSSSYNSMRFHKGDT